MYDKRNTSIYGKVLDDSAPITSDNKIWSISKISEEFAQKELIQYINAKIEDLDSVKFDKVTLEGNKLKFFANSVEKFSITLTADALDLSSLTEKLNTKFDSVELTENNLVFKVGDTVKTTIALPKPPEIINDLVTGGADKILSAEMGKVLNNKINKDTSEIISSRTDYFGKDYPNLETRLNKEFEYVHISDTKGMFSPFENKNEYYINNSIEGRLKDTVIKGNTFQNINPESIAFCNNINSFNHCFESVFKGQEDGCIRFTNTSSKANSFFRVGYDNSTLLKPSTYYALICDAEIIKNTNNLDFLLVAESEPGKLKQTKIQSGRGICCTLFQSVDPGLINAPNRRWINAGYYADQSVKEDCFKLYSFSMFEITESEYNLGFEYILSKYPQKPIANIKNCGEGENLQIKSCGLNLFNEKKFVEFYGLTYEEGKLIINKPNTNFFNVNTGNRKVYIKFRNEGNDIESAGSAIFSFIDYLGNTQYIATGGAEHTTGATNPAPKRFINNGIKSMNIVCWGGGKSILSEIQISASSEEVEWQPYKENMVSIELQSPLMRLPSGVSDEISQTNKVIKKINKIQLTGEEDMYMTGGETKPDLYVFYIPVQKFNACFPPINDKSTFLRNGYCDNLPILSYGEVLKVPGICLKEGGLNISFNKTQIPDLVGDAPDYQKAISWLKKNKPTLYYELETPTTSDIFNLNVNLKTFDNFTAVLSDNSIPPFMNFLAPVSVKGSIVSLQKENEELKKSLNKAKEFNNILSSKINELEEEFTSVQATLFRNKK